MKRRMTSSLLAAGMLMSSFAGLSVTANAAEYTGLPSVGSKAKFDFGATTSDGWTQVTADTAYTDNRGYGFLGQSEETLGTDNIKAVVDGYTQTASNMTNIQNGGSGELTDYVYTEDVNKPIRFAVKAENNTYYKIKVTMGSSDKDSKIYLTSERRHFVVLNESVSAGETLTKEFTVAVHNVRWKDRVANNNNALYEDDMINVCVLGENPTLNTIEIERIEKPKVVWVFGDSTVTDAASGVPWFGYNTYTGWGASVAHYLPDNIAVVNLAEGGLSTANTGFFNVGLVDMKAGDIVLMQMGHNDSSPSTYITNVEKDYYNQTVATGATFVLCSPIERLSDVSTVKYHETAEAFTTAKGIPFVPLHTLTKDMYSSLGNVKKWYTHTALWEGTAANPKAKNDASHLNDFGSDMTTAMLFESLAGQAEKFPVLAPYVTVYSTVTTMVPDDDFMKAGTSNYVKPPTSLFPYPAASIDYANTVDVTSADVVNVDGKNYLRSYKTVRHSDLSYITAFAATYDKNGRVAAIGHNRLEPMSAKMTETVYLNTGDHPNGLEIPDGGSYKAFVWEGALSDKSMTYDSFSNVFTGYDYANEGLSVTGSGSVYNLDTPVTSGKVSAEYTITPNSGTVTMALSPNADGSNGIVLSMNSTTGAVSYGGNTVIDSFTAGTPRRVVLTYDIDYGVLKFNADDVGIVDITIPGAVTTSGLNPSQIASLAFTGDAAISDVKLSTLKSDPLPNKTITIDYDSSLGTVTAPASAIKNSYVTIKAEPDTSKGIVFGGWYLRNSYYDEINENEVNEETLFSSDEETSFYLVDDMSLRAWFYEQKGVEGVASYDITTSTPLVNVPTTGTNTVTLDIADIRDDAGNPTADFDHNSNVTWNLLNAVDGVTVSGSTISVAAGANIAQEDVLKLKVQATCNGVSKTTTVLVANCTNIVFSDTFESGTVGSAASGWTLGVDGRYTAKYNRDSNGYYVDIQPVNSNNGTAIYKEVMNSATGIVEVKADVCVNKPNDQTSSICLMDNTTPGSSYISGNSIVKITVDKNSNYAVNGTTLENKPSDGSWASLTAVMNFNTKTVYIKYTSLDGTETYYDAETTFADSAAKNFKYIAYGTGRSNGSAKLDNLVVDQIATAADLAALTASPSTVEIADMTKQATTTVTLPAGWSIKSVASSDTNIATAAFDGSTVTVTPVAYGDATVTVTAGSDTNSFIKAQTEIAIAMKSQDNADLSGLSLKADGTGNELVEDFALETTSYTERAASSMSTVKVTPVTDNSQATYVITYNGAAVSGDTVTIDKNAASQVIAVTVTAPDGITTKAYTVTLDNSYLVAENFSSGSGTWGFTAATTSYNKSVASISDGVLTLNKNINQGSTVANTTMYRSLDTSSLSKVSVSFDWMSNIESGQGRTSYFALQDLNGKMIFGLYGHGKNGLYFFKSIKDGSDYEPGTTTYFAAFSHNWYSTELTIDFANSKVTGSIKDTSGNTVKSIDETITSGATSLGRFFVANTYSLAEQAIDNVYIKAVN